MIKIICVILALVSLAGCSTVEKYKYFSPVGTSDFLTGPKRPICGFANFGGNPDGFKFAQKDKVINFEAYQDVDPYFIGPWFVSVVPIFPVSWLYDVFRSNDLIVTFEGEQNSLSKLKEEDFLISFKGQVSKPLVLTSSSLKTYYSPQGNYFRTIIKFPIDQDEINEFTLEIRGTDQDGKPLKLIFLKSFRWAWSQWSPNC